MHKFSMRLKEALDLRNMRQTELAEKIDVARSSITQYLKGEFVPRQDTLYKISKVLNVGEAWLMGFIDEMERVPDYKRHPSYKEDDSIFQYDNIVPVINVDVPFIGNIQCGTPHEAVENAEIKTVQFPEDFKIDFDFALKCKGDSMINAGIEENDYVFVRKQEIVNNGEIAVVLNGEEATLKRFYHYPEKATIILRAENPTFDTMIFTGKEIEGIKIIGKAVAILNRIKTKRL